MSLEEERLDLALKASNEGILDWDLQTGEIYYSNRLLGFLGYGQFWGAKHLRRTGKTRASRRFSAVDSEAKSSPVSGWEVICR